MLSLSSIQDKRYKYGDIGASVKSIIDNDLEYAKFMYRQGYWILDLEAREYLFDKGSNTIRGCRSVGIRKHY